MGLSSFFKSTSTTFDPLSAYTPEQRKSLDALLSLANTGSGGGINLGELYGGNLGYYQQAPGEQQALSGLQGLVNGQDISGARDVFSKATQNTFNPDDPSSGYAAFSRALAKSGNEAQDQINQQAAITGGVFGSGRGRDTASLQADLANQRGMFLADLFNQGQNRAIQGAQGLQGLVGTQQNLYGQIAEQAQIERLLKDQQAKDRYAEFNRGRNEELSRIGLMQDQFNNPMAPITTTSPSMFSQIAPSLFGQIGTAIAPGVGNAIGSGIGNLFSSFGSQGTSSSINSSNSRLLDLYNSGGFNPQFGF